MYNLTDKIITTDLNVHVELRLLENTAWIEAGQPSKKAIELMKRLDSLFKTAKKKSEKEVLGEAYEQNILKYNELFPKIKLPNGKAARTNPRELVDAFKWFFENYEYSWEAIFDATTNYVADFSTRGYMYMRTSKYFIRKQTNDKSWGSDLAEWCDILENPPDNFTPHFKDNVV